MKSSHKSHLEIAVQPPAFAGVYQQLEPPVIARTRDPQLVHGYLSGDIHLFGTLLLYSSNMTDCSTRLSGTWSASAVLVTETAGSGSGRGGNGSSSRSTSQQWLYFIFNPVSVHMEGTFTFKVVVSALVLSSATQNGGSEAVCSKATQPFTILNRSPGAHSPSDSERDVLHGLKSKGLIRRMS